MIRDMFIIGTMFFVGFLLFTNSDTLLMKIVGVVIFILPFLINAFINRQSTKQESDS